MNEDATNMPQSFLDFQNADSVELVRAEDETWNGVDGHVKVDNHDGRRRIIVCGRPHGRTRRHNSLRGGNVRVEIIPSAPEQLELWLNQIRARIAPWQLLQREVRDIANRSPSCGVAEIERTLGGLSADLYSFPVDRLEGKRTDNLGTLSEQTEEPSILDELIAHGSAAVETCAALSKLVAEHVAETAEVVADLSKCVAGVSTIFHLVALGAQGVSMCAEASRGRRVLHVLLGQIMVLLQYTLKSMAEVMKASRSVDQTDVDFVFDVFKQAIDAMDLAETQLLRGRGSQIMNAGNLKEVERKLEDLIHRAVTAGTISKVCTMGEEVKQLKEEQGSWNDGLRHTRPSLSAFFSGRSRELGTLRKILEKRGSAVITQYGGVGKTELMIALADRAERDEVVPGGVFWVTVDGCERDAIRSLAELAEKLTRRRMREEERRNPNMVLTALKKGLDGRNGRWLLCLDNADDSKVSGILNEVCGMARATRGNGWIVVTSRQGQPHIWNRMKRDQKLVLGPLCAEDAMVALWRQIQKIEMGDADDAEVINSIKELERDNAKEYRALKELCGDEGGCCLGGLPLALVQAGTYMARFECSFVEYLHMFQNANRIEDMQDIMKNTEEVKLIRESQKSIWTTWKISVEKLSQKGYAVLRVIAMLGQGGVGEAIVKEIVKGLARDEEGCVERMFRNVVVEELIHGSSLICRDEEGQRQEQWTYKMHRLVRRFIVSDMERGSALWNELYSVALVTVHERVESELEKEGKSFAEFPDIFGSNHHEFVSHATALVDHHTLPGQGGEIRHVSKVEDIHRYSAEVMEFMGRVEEEVQMWTRYVDLLHHRQAANKRENCNGLLLDIGNEEKTLIASAYNSLGLALVRNGKLNDGASMHEQSLEIRLEIHGPDKPHSAIAKSLNNLGSAYLKLGELEKALEKHEESLEMNLAIHGHDKPHPVVAASLNNLGGVYVLLGKLDEALKTHNQSLEMNLAIHEHKKPHPAVATSLNNLGRVYQGLGKLDEALEKHEQSLEMSLAIYGHGKPHPTIVRSLNNLAHVYHALGELDKSLENHKQSLVMYRVIYGNDRPHPDIAQTLWHIGVVYHEQKALNQAAEFLEQSLGMLRIVHPPDSPHPLIRAVLYDLADVYEEQGRGDEAMAMRERNERNTETDETSDDEALDPASVS